MILFQFCVSRLRCLPEGYAPQVLPRKDWSCLQRDQDGCRRCRQQARQGKDSTQEDLCQDRAREALQVQEGFLGQSSLQRGQEEGGQDYWHRNCLQEVSNKLLSL